jgi:hypothetical protein
MPWTHWTSWTMAHDMAWGVRPLGERACACAAGYPRRPGPPQNGHALNRASSGPVQAMNIAIATYWHVAAAQTQA